MERVNVIDQLINMLHLDLPYSAYSNAHPDENITWVLLCFVLCVGIDLITIIVVIFNLGSNQWKQIAEHAVMVWDSISKYGRHSTPMHLQEVGNCGKNDFFNFQIIFWLGHVLQKEYGGFIQVRSWLPYKIVLLSSCLGILFFCSVSVYWQGLLQPYDAGLLVVIFKKAL